MRITGGQYRGRQVACPPGIIRPAMDRMRESLFSILAHQGRLEGASFLDLFSGSGVVGIEAASRGAEPVHLVELDRGKQEIIRRNISFVDTEIRLYLQRARKFLKTAARSYDVIYADPPFVMEGKVQLIELADRCRALKPSGICIIHHPAEEQWPERIGSLVCTDIRTYGRSVLRFFSRLEPNPEAAAEPIGFPEEQAK